MPKVFDSTIGQISFTDTKIIIDNEVHIYLKDIKYMTYNKRNLFNLLCFWLNPLYPDLPGHLVIKYKNGRFTSIGIKYKYVKQFPQKILSKIDII